jgi:ABC-type multidrug transport system ATPase subunit
VSNNVLSVKGLSKTYGAVQALNDVSFDVPRGSVFGILGPNGSGKTTLLSIVLDIIHAKAGTYSWFEQGASSALRKQIGALLETPNFYHYLSAERNLKINCAIKGIGEADIEKVLKIVRLYERKDYPFSSFSLGMKQRLAIASALLGNPDILVFDEPTNGLDPVGIAEIRALLKQLSIDGKTIIMASHLLHEVEQVCTHMAILKKGKLITAGNVNEVLVNDDMVELGANDMQALQNAVQSFDGHKKAEMRDGFLIMLFESGQANIEAINQHCFTKGVVLNHLVMKKRSLESKFIELTN